MCTANLYNLLSSHDQSTKLEIFLQQSRLDHYIFMPESKPDHLVTEPNPTSKPVAHTNWLTNNDLIVGVICAAISNAEQDSLKTDGTAKECYDALKARAHHKEPIKQVVLIYEALTTYAPVAEPVKTIA
ncbi:hypothetical protein C0995_008741 [Termitomyces sp. Mi166|nr:hypothetical protein C0995_008741 [Termitomyces sp. Mi166\